MSPALRLPAPRVSRVNASCGPSSSGRVVPAPPAGRLPCTSRARASAARSLASSAPDSGADSKAAEERARVQAFLERLLRGDPAAPAPLQLAAVHAGGALDDADGGGVGFYVTLDEKPAPSQDSPSGQDPEDPDRKAREYYANLGYAIRTLREDIPILFVKDLNCEPACCLPPQAFLCCPLTPSPSEPVQ